jgi:hypothetical protein
MVFSLIYQLWYLLTSSHLSATAINTAAWALHMTSQFHPLPPLSVNSILNDNAEFEKNSFVQLKE